MRYPILIHLDNTPFHHFFRRISNQLWHWSASSAWSPAQRHLDKRPQVAGVVLAAPDLTPTEAHDQRVWCPKMAPGVRCILRQMTKIWSCRICWKKWRGPCLLCSSSIFVTSAPQRRSGRAAGLQDESRRNAEARKRIRWAKAPHPMLVWTKRAPLAMEKNLPTGAMLEKWMQTATRTDMKTCWQILLPILFLHSWFMWKMGACKIIISLQTTDSVMSKTSSFRHALRINRCNPGHKMPLPSSQAEKRAAMPTTSHCGPGHQKIQHINSRSGLMSIYWLLEAMMQRVLLQWNQVITLIYSIYFN